ncbi:MAG TPA: malto-oligosyltrehalose trehalohydrolase [Candidatus Omnitrophota bacterium]|nr:malto-oligosyltrehalose trehalohydrolase [Candidatus Omnitrophota bacterium]
MKKLSWELALGARPMSAGRTSFRVWAPRASRVEVKILRHAHAEIFPLQNDAEGYFGSELDGVRPGDLYWYVLDGEKERPDPVSRFQPEGVHGPSGVVDPTAFSWSDGGFRPRSLRELVFYEVHIGTFTPRGTFESAIEKIPYLKKLGINCLEIMPVAQFPGKYNWGYDGVGLFAPQNSYGGPAGLKKLINACHRHGIAICLDVVYNHLGPEGNYLHDFGPYFTNKYHVPWGDAVNFDGAESGPVREHVISNALYWVMEYHVDALRLDAIHGIFDFGARHILEELGARVKEEARKVGREVLIIPESDLNDSRVIRPRAAGGYALDAQWSDDFHHAAHVCLTGERSGYYEDFSSLRDLQKAWEDGFVYDGRYSSFRKRRHGDPVKDLPTQRLVVAIQNHDQVGNRAFGDRLGALLSFEKQKLAAALLLLSPFTPLLFMGEEYGERNPFLYFVDHGDPDLRRAVREGRKAEFASFGWKDTPDPSALKTFLASRLDWTRPTRTPHRHLLSLYRDLIRLRRSFWSGKTPLKIQTHLDEEGSLLAVRYRSGKRKTAALFSFSDEERKIPLPFSGKKFNVILNTNDPRYKGKKVKKKYLKEVPLNSFCAIVGTID